MMNRIFYALVLIAFLTAAWHQVTWTPPAPDPATGVAAAATAPAPMDALTKSIFDEANRAIVVTKMVGDKPIAEAGILVKLVGGMTLFLGLMKVVEKGGGLAIAAKVVRPLMVRLFPDVPPNHPAMGAMIMNLSANLLGLGNAATPFGIRAMEELDKLNPHKGTATNAQALFLAINTSSVTLLATGVMVQRQGAGSRDAAAVIGTTLLATTFSTVAGILGCKLLERFSPEPPATDPVEATATSDVDDAYPLWVSLLALAGVVAFTWATYRYGSVVSVWLVPVLVVGFLSFGFARGVPVYEAFIDGAKEGWQVAVRIVPYLVAILVAVGMLQSSGALQAFTSFVGPWTSPLGLPAEALPMALLRPLSGSGASGVMLQIINDPKIGPDSYTGLLVSTMQGSSETTFYVLAVYFGAVQVKNMRHSLAAGLIADFFGVVGSIVAVTAYLSR